MDTSAMLPDSERWLLLLVAFILAVLALFAKEFLVTRYLVSLGSKDKWWNPVRFKPPPASYAIMKKNNKDGDFSMIIHSVIGHYLDDDYNFVKIPTGFYVDKDHKLVELNPGESPPAPGFLEKRGLVYVGFNKAYYRQKIEYASWEKLPDKPEYGVVTKTRNSEVEDIYYFFQYTNVLVHVTKADVKGNVPVDMKILITLRHRNPYKVHFLTGKWIVRGTALVERVVREIVGAKEYEEVRSMREAEADEIEDALTKAYDTGDLGKGPAEKIPFNVKYGLEFDDPELLTIDPVVDPDTEKSMKAKAVAQMEAEAEDARNERKSKAAVGEADRIRKVLAAVDSSPNGPAVMFYEAIREAKPKTIVLGSIPGVNTSIPTDE